MITSYRAKVSDKYFDLLWAAHDLRKAVSIKISPKHVAGHQDGKKRKLNLYERLNVECDTRSKNFRAKIENGDIIHEPVQFGYEHWSVALGQFRMSYGLKSSINEHVLGTKLINKMISRSDLTRQMVPMIDWDAMEGASKMQTSGERLWLAKFVSGFIATAIQMSYRDQKRKTETQEEFENDYRRWKCDKCPVCKKERETQYHILVCTSKRIYKRRMKTINDMSKWFDEQRTDPLISQCVDSVLRQDGNLSFKTAMTNLTLDSNYLHAAACQDIIGFKNFIIGRVSREWKHLQAQYLIRTYPDKRYSAIAWVKRWVYRIYKRMGDLWKNRCDLVHKMEGKEISRREKRALKLEIKQQYALGKDGLRANDKELLDRPLSKVLAFSAKNKKYWIRTLQNSRIFVTDFESNIYSGMRSVMRRWASVPI